MDTFSLCVLDVCDPLVTVTFLLLIQLEDMQDLRTEINIVVSSVFENLK